MKLLKLLFYPVILFYPSTLFSNAYVNKIVNIRSRITRDINIEPISTPSKNKFESLLGVIRANNIVPTLFLSGAGGWITNPTLFQPRTFYIVTINTLLIMSASMVINDLYDIEVDKINSPHRPLITGDITKREAVALTISLLGASEYLSLRFLPVNLQWIVHFSILYINLYTPIFKKILVIKNISCAALVSFAIFFTGLASTQVPLIVNKNLDLLVVACNVVFTGSWANEILLDIRDYKGDKKQGLQTLPIILSKQSAWTCVWFILYIGIITNSLVLLRLFNLKIAELFVLIMVPQVWSFYNIKKNRFSNDSIKKYISYTNKTLFAILLFIIKLS